MKPHIQALQRTLLRIIRSAGAVGMTPAEAKAAAAIEHPSIAAGTIDHTFTAMIRAQMITGKGSKRRRQYVATGSNSDEQAAAAQQRAEIYAPRPLTSWPPKHRPRPDPDWMRKEAAR